MGKSRPRPSADKLIIDRPELQTPRQRVVFTVATVAAWAMWFYLWLPLITLAGWYFGYTRFQEVMIVQGGAAALFAAAGGYALIVAAMCGALLLWACYNWVRFRNSKRRLNAPARVRRAEMLRRTRVPKEMLEAAHAMRCMTVHHNEKGVVVRIEERTLPASPSTEAPSSNRRAA